MESPLIILGRLIRHLNKASGEIFYSYEPEINEFGDLITLIFQLTPFRYQFHENSFGVIWKDLDQTDQKGKMVIFQGSGSGNRSSQLNVVIPYFSQFLRIFRNFLRQFVHKGQNCHFEKTMEGNHPKIGLAS